MKALPRRLTYANVMATIAVFIALGGSAYAATQLKKNSVGTKQLKNNAVTTAKIKKEAITNAKLSASAKKALEGANGATGPGGKQGSEGKQGPKGETGAPATKLWAVLGGAGNLVRGSGVTSTSSGKTGVQTVIFNQNVSACAFIAAPGSLAATSGTTSYPAPGEAAIGPLEGNPNDVVVSRATGEKPNELIAFPVYVAVFC